MKGWDSSHIEKLRSRGMVVSTLISGKNIPQNQVKNIPHGEPKPLREMKQVLKFMQIHFETEFKFMADRKFRFDIAIPESKIAIEYEGLFSSKSRHTTVTGYTIDTQKYNLAQIEGWKILRYTQMNYKQFLSDLNKII